ncbi:glycosyltransferase involved in cell wall biosynthesis [Duganella sp. SG902]|uniref:glycosyltransferase family 2 protein n=1 Tax=Duganella sp. SG902 TaxID=2587016 RepID=UPI00159D680F|nr:glycosyltransferase family 2 protein [Duganella sp. SG902]NVM78706.1 glycosyltransferase involved in cell wall biosynthesis [Duganella sp. SG902]
MQKENVSSAVPRIAVVLPAYNEELTIADTIRDFATHLPEARIYVINNNSKDKTGPIAREVLAGLGNAGGVIDELRQGKGNALRRAFHSIDADVYVLADADMTYPASRARDLIAPIVENRADMVVGDRHSGGHYARENTRSLHGFGNALVQHAVNTLFSAKLVDIMSGYRVFSRAFVKSYPILVEGFQIETDMTLHALHKRFRIVEIPVEYKDRPAGSFSKLNTLSDGAKVIFTIAQILRYYRPLMFFGSLALLASLLGVLSAVPVLIDWFSYKYIYHVPLAVLAASLEIFAIVLLAIGLILDSLSHQQRLQFERSLLAGTDAYRS